MISRHKKLCIGLSVYVVLAYVLPLPFIFLFDRTDLLGISSIVFTLLLLLAINIRAGRNLKYRFKKEYLTKKEKVKKETMFIESQRILWIYFFLILILTIILCFVTF